MRLAALCLAALAFACATTTPAAAPPATTAAAAAPDDEHHTGIQPLVADPSGGIRVFDKKPEPGQKAICAVSGEAFTITAETKTAEYQGKWYAFCCDECAPAFAADPKKFAAN